jgi:hypothetical protein
MKTDRPVSILREVQIDHFAVIPVQVTLISGVVRV